jgi:hypothetical protein
MTVELTWEDPCLVTDDEVRARVTAWDTPRAAAA